MKGWYTGSRSHCRVDDIAARKAFMRIDWHRLMFCTVFILHILPKGPLVLGSIAFLILRIDIHSLVPLSRRSQLSKRIEDMCRNVKHARRWSYISQRYFSLWKTPGVSERMWSVNLEASISGEYQTLGGYSGRPSLGLESLTTSTGVTGISDDWYRSTMGVIVISLGARRSARENFGCTWEGRQTSTGITNTP